MRVQPVSKVMADVCQTSRCRSHRRASQIKYRQMRVGILSSDHAFHFTSFRRFSILHNVSTRNRILQGFHCERRIIDVSTNFDTCWQRKRWMKTERHARAIKASSQSNAIACFAQRRAISRQRDKAITYGTIDRLTNEMSIVHGERRIEGNNDKNNGLPV